MTQSARVFSVERLTADYSKLVVRSDSTHRPTVYGHVKNRTHATQLKLSQKRV